MQWWVRSGSVEGAGDATVGEQDGVGHSVDVLVGRNVDDDSTAAELRSTDDVDEPAAMELVRLTFPRRTYTQSHVDWLGEVIAGVFERRSEAPGYKITKQGAILRAFTAELEPFQVSNPQRS